MTSTPPVRITLEMLHATFEQISDVVAPSHGNKSFMLAAAILKHFFGEGWIERHLDRPGYLQIDEMSETTRDLKGLRLIDLAEVIYNLQNVPGFNNCIARMRDGDIEGTAAELDLGRMLILNRVLFRYIVPQGLKGKDYDAEITYPGGVVVCADAKCALENSDLRSTAIFNKLEKARKQLPSDRPGIIFAKVPSHWMAQPKFVSTTVDQAHELFRQSERIVSIKFYVAPMSIKDGYAKIEHAYKELSNPKTRFPLWDWTLFRPLSRRRPGCMPAHWQRILMFPDGPIYGDPAGPLRSPAAWPECRLFTPPPLHSAT